MTKKKVRCKLVYQFLRNFFFFTWSLESYVESNLRILTGKSTLKLNSSACEKYEYGDLGR